MTVTLKLMKPIKLEPVEIKHAEAIQRLASDPAIGATTRIPVPYPGDGAVTWIRSLSERRQLGDEYAFAVIAEENKLVGVCGVVGIWRERKAAEIGYWIGRPYWGRGHATAAVQMLIDWAFWELPVNLLFAHVLSSNKASSRVLEKVGFKCLRWVDNTDPKWSLSEKLGEFELTRESWSALRNEPNQSNTV